MEEMEKDCDEVAPLLQRYANVEEMSAAEEETVQTHLAECEVCSRLLIEDAFNSVSDAYKTPRSVKGGKPKKINKKKTARKTKKRISS